MSPVRVLCLHGYHGTAAGLRRQLVPLLPDPNPVEFVYVDAPSLARRDFGWWHLNFRGWQDSVDWLVGQFEERGPVHGVLGFSQGATMASLLVGKPLGIRFTILVGGFRSDSAEHADLYTNEKNYTIPSVHIMGRNDSVVPMRDSRLLAEQFADPIVLEHPGGHVIPDDPAIAARVARFLSDQC